MRNKHEFEIITDKTSYFKSFVNVLKYRSPHIHLDYEMGIILNGELIIRIEDQEYLLAPGDILCLNPCEIHELEATNQVTLLLLQVNPAYFHRLYPAMQNIIFTKEYIKADDTNPTYLNLKEEMYKFASTYMKKEDKYELKCAGLLNFMFCDILELFPQERVSSEMQNSARNKADRIRRIADYLEKNYSEKIKLSDLADLENITVTHMSHFFTDNFHMTFQDYLTKLRCEKARSLLLMTDLSLFDISFSCGFSDPKYFNKGFLKQYNCSPKEYRSNFGHEKLDVQQASMLTTQQIMSDKTSLVILSKYVS